MVVICDFGSIPYGLIVEMKHNMNEPHALALDSLRFAKRNKERALPAAACQGLVCAVLQRGIMWVGTDKSPPPGKVWVFWHKLFSRSRQHYRVLR